MPSLVDAILDDADLPDHLVTVNAAEEMRVVLDRHLSGIVGALDRVRALHRPSTDHRPASLPYCVGCWEAGGYDGAPSHPCPTIAALDG